MKWLSLQDVSSPPRHFNSLAYRWLLTPNQVQVTQPYHHVVYSSSRRLDSLDIALIFDSRGERSRWGLGELSGQHFIRNLQLPLSKSGGRGATAGTYGHVYVFMCYCWLCFPFLCSTLFSICSNVNVSQSAYGLQALFILLKHLFKGANLTAAKILLHINSEVSSNCRTICETSETADNSWEAETQLKLKHCHGINIQYNSCCGIL